MQCHAWCRWGSWSRFSWAVCCAVSTLKLGEWWDSIDDPRKAAPWVIVKSMRVVAVVRDGTWKRGVRVCRDVELSHTLQKRVRSKVWVFSTSLNGNRWYSISVVLQSHPKSIRFAFYFLYSTLGKGLVMLQCCFCQTRCLPQSCKSLASVPNSCCFVNRFNAATWRAAITSFEARR